MTSFELLATECPRRPWSTLFYKDFRLTLVAASMGLVILLLLQLGFRWYFKGEWPGTFLTDQDKIVMFLIANFVPVLMAIAVAGTSGYEYHQGINSWISSLPTSPGQAYFSKFSVWLILTFAIHTILTFVALFLCEFQISGDIQALLRNAAMAYLIGLQLLLILKFAMLLFEPILGLVLGGAILVGFQAGLLIYQSPSDFKPEIYFSLQAVGTLVFLGASCYVMHWRWGNGLFSKWLRLEGFGRFIFPVSAVFVVTAVTDWSKEVDRLEKKRRRPFLSLICQAYQSQRGLLWTLVAVAILFIAAEMFANYISSGREFYNRVVVPTVLVGTVIAILLGVNTFGVDRQQDRYQFLSCRGVGPGMIFLSRLLVTGLAILLLSLFYLRLLQANERSFPNGIPSSSIWFLILIPYLAGILTGMISRNMTLAFLGVLLGFVVFVFVAGSMLEILPNQAQAWLRGIYDELQNSDSLGKQIVRLVLAGCLAIYLWLLNRQVGCMIKNHQVSKGLALGAAGILAIGYWISLLLLDIAILGIVRERKLSDDIAIATSADPAPYPLPSPVAKL